jgi:cell division protein FtsI (penicillin-binding protein 3)
MFLRQTKLKIDRKVPKQEKNYNNYFAELQSHSSQFLMLKGCQGCDCFIGEFRVKVKAVGMGRLTQLQAGQDIIKTQL